MMARAIADAAYRREASRPLGKTAPAPGTCSHCGDAIALKSLVMIDGSECYHLACGFQHEMERGE
jgi:hypothetical protein